MLHFHKAELVDAQDIAALINSAYRGESSRAGWTTEADILDGLRTTTQEVASIIKREDAFILVGVLRDQIVATICCEKQDAYGRNIAHLGMIAVKPTLQNKGHGATMIQAAEAMTAREWRVVGFHMAVITLREELIAFYERLGYARSGEFKNFPENTALWQPKVAGLTLEYLVKIIKR
ncbi:MAG: GNAT family N-acetyltransferase [Methylotenera sp.]|nr:GNAT family N-acetyltransferase [Methylotenera sp.]PPD56755.1 MAG: GNAT family N-acetyltransferase [Methylotenera sp.]